MTTLDELRRANLQEQRRSAERAAAAQTAAAPAAPAAAPPTGAPTSPEVPAAEVTKPKETPAEPVRQAAPEPVRPAVAEPVRPAPAEPVRQAAPEPAPAAAPVQQYEAPAAAVTMPSPRPQRVEEPATHAVAPEAMKPKNGSAFPAVTVVPTISIPEAAPPPTELRSRVQRPEATEEARRAAEALISAATPQADGPDDTFVEQVRERLSKRVIYRTGVKATVDMPPELFWRLKRYCHDHNNLTVRQAFLDLMIAYLEHEGY